MKRKRDRDGAVEMSVGITMRDGMAYVESRARAMDDRGPIPRGKVLVSRTPILPPGASDEDVAALTEEELIDEDSEAAFCPWCAEAHRPDAGHEPGHGPIRMHELDARPGRNERCPCGSGRKFKKCCLTRIH